MSRSARGAPAKLDPRVRRTRDRLGDALVALILEKPFDAITVQDVLARADVGRSTFYAHFSDKNDLFLSDIDQFFEHMAMHLSLHRDPSHRVAPVRELFAHVADFRRFHAALVASGRMPDVRALGEGHFARGIAQRLADLPQAHGLAAEARSALAQGFAGALFSLLFWWLDRQDVGSAERMDELFHRMVWNGVRSEDGAGAR